MRKTLLAIGMALASCAAIAATEVVDGIEWRYWVTNGEATVGSPEARDAVRIATAVSPLTTGDIAIPSSLGKCPVTSIGEMACYRCSGLTSVTMPRSVTSIGVYAFYGCSGLTSVAIPSSVTNIGNAAFSICRGLKDVTVPGWDCGMDLSSVTNLVISEGTTSIRNNAFEGDSTIKSVTIPNSVTSIGCRAFWDCSGLESVTIPNSVTNIGERAFYGCSGLTSVTIPGSVARIGLCAFQGCGGLAMFDVAESNPNYKSTDGLLLTKDGRTLVSGINGDITIPSGVTSIDNYAFSSRSELTSVTIPSSVTSIGGYAFHGCGGLMSVTLEGDAPASEANIFTGTPSDMVVHAKGNSSGWTQWNGRVIRFDADSGSGTSATSVNVNMTITNVIVHYIQTSELSPMAAPITKDVGIVNVMTEVKGGNVSIPESWATNWPSFKATFGEDFADALTRQTGKFDAGGKPMMVWQDFVAGTDPTDKDDVFKASITTDANGNLIVSYTPELSEPEKAKRKYTTWGKVKLRDEKWVEVPAGREDDYNFFKVTVEMR